MMEAVKQSETKMNSIAVMQPTFVPWLGYFALIAQVDYFVFLDDVQYSKQSWQSRNQISGPNGPMLISLPIARKPSFQMINKTFLANINITEELMPRIKACLGKAPYWDLVEHLLTKGFARSIDGLSALNIGLIVDLCTILKLGKTFHRTSDLNIITTEKTERLLAIAQRFGVKTYLSPVGSAAYLRVWHPFTETATRLRFLEFVHPEYRQRWQPFRSHMSVIDALAWEGPEATRAIIMKGIGNPRRLEELQVDIIDKSST